MNTSPFRLAVLTTLLAGSALAQVPCFDPNFGINLGLGDDAGAMGMQLGFGFAFDGQTYTTIDVCSNGYFWLGGAPGTNPWDYSPSVNELLTAGPRICPLWNDFDPSAPGSGQVWFSAVPASGANPARAVITWDRVYEYNRTTPITLQCQIVDGGGIFFFYDPGITAVLGGFNPGSQIVGMSPGAAATANPVVWSSLFPGGAVTMSTATAHQLFASGQFNLIGRSIEFLPTGASAYVALPRPQCNTVAAWRRLGNGCPHGLTFYETFGSGQVDLQNRSIRYQPAAGGGYRASAGPGLDTTYAAQQVVGDDQVLPFALPFAFPFLGNTLNTVDVSSNGFLWMTGGTLSQPGVSLTDFLLQGPRIAMLWADLDPSAGGQVFFDASPQRAMVTWVAVPQYAQAGSANTLQVVLLPSGEFVVSYGALSLPAGSSLVGVTEGGSAADPGVLDISASLPFAVGAVGSVPLALDAAPGSRPAINGTFQLQVTGVPAGSGLAALIMAFGTANLDLGGLGMPTCRQYVNLQGSANLFQPVGGSSVTFPLPIPNNVNLLGLVVDLQAATFSPAANPLGVVTSNGGQLTVGL